MSPVFLCSVALLKVGTVTPKLHRRRTGRANDAGEWRNPSNKLLDILRLTSTALYQKKHVVIPGL